ncbi:PREDICTED: uncharacterized protein LOC106804684 [Priapulus caudatus]|uniref:Uncharacterized protein LOC106804684 n=1 Tax=Priapulus caudatus TaxID=37621 RepID=A0ABM1DNC7_PRICU|nr:PREDICTED: uncharacterized protein LOC106804684 [Priapulus caudatus]
MDDVTTSDSWTTEVDTTEGVTGSTGRPLAFLPAHYALVTVACLLLLAAAIISLYAMCRRQHQRLMAVAEAKVVLSQLSNQSGSYTTPLPDTPLQQQKHRSSVEILYDYEQTTPTPGGATRRETEPLRPVGGASRFSFNFERAGSILRAVFSVATTRDDARDKRQADQRPVSMLSVDRIMGRGDETACTGSNPAVTTAAPSSGTSDVRPLPAVRKTPDASDELQTGEGNLAPPAACQQPQTTESRARGGEDDDVDDDDGFLIGAVHIEDEQIREASRMTSFD